MRVLLIRLGAFGDLLHTLPLAADLTAAGHQVGWLCEDRWAQVLSGSQAIQRIHTIPRRVLRSGSFLARMRALRTVIHELRDASYDVVIDAQGLAKSGLAAWLSGAAIRLGHARPRAREGSWLISQRRIRSAAVHVIDQQRDLARLLEIEPQGRWAFPLPAWTAERAWAVQVVHEAQLRQPWALNVGAGWPTKVWPVARQIEFAKALGTRGTPLLIVWGSAAEHQVAQQIVDQADHGVIAPPSTIPQLAGLLAVCAVVVSGDTGPLHLALALGTPAVGLFGPVPAERNGPRGVGYRTLQAPGAAWERRDVSKVEMGAITADQVIAAADEAVAERITL